MRNHVTFHTSMLDEVTEEHESMLRESLGLESKGPLRSDVCFSLSFRRQV